MKINQVLLEMLLKTFEDQNRGTGRSTGIALTAIGQALQNPGLAINIKDHHQTHAATDCLIDMMMDIIEKLGLKYITISRSGRTIIYTPFVEIK